MNESDRPAPIRADLLGEGEDGPVRHGFFTRRGGVSGGFYAGLNAGQGSRDRAAAVRENRARIAGHLGLTPDRLVTVHQVHSPDVAVVDAPFQGDRPKADAMVTATPGLALSVLTADCGPVLLADVDNRVAGAAHAGWKGALTGVLENTVAAMERLGARRDGIGAVLGPSISQANYEVGPEFVDRFLAADAANDRYFKPSSRPGHALFDLQAYTADRLSAAGVRTAVTGHCTYANEALFFSYRRTTHRGEPDYGRQLSAIALHD